MSIHETWTHPPYLPDTWHWQFMARSQISSSFQISRWLLSLSTSVQCWPVSAAGTILLLWLCSHCVVTILCGQAEIVQQVVRKESAIQTHYILHCIFCNLAKQEKMWVNRTSCENKSWGFETMLSFDAALHIDRSHLGYFCYVKTFICESFW